MTISFVHSHPRFSGLSLTAKDKYPDKKTFCVTLVAADCNDNIENNLKDTTSLTGVKIGEAIEKAGIMPAQIKINNNHLGASKIIATLSGLLKEADSFSDFFKLLPEENLRKSLASSFEKKHEIPEFVASAQSQDVSEYKDSKKRFKETIEQGKLTTGETEEKTRFIRFTLNA